MTAPRQVLAGSCYMVTRRCAQREFLLRPSETVNDIFLYALAVATQRYPVKVHAFCVLSNHVHLVVSDPEAQLPRFQQFLHAQVARAVNASLGRWESFWAPGSYSAVRLDSAEDVIDKTAYVLANPVAAGLVRTGRMWPGLWSDPDRFGTRIEVERPHHFFAAKGGMPARASLELTAPPGFSSIAEFRDRVTAAVGEREREAQREHKGKFVGVAKVLKQDPRSRPSSFEPRRNLRPRIAAKDKWRRIEALTRLSTFVREYRRALAARRAGDLGAVFPPGTYLLRVAHGVPCAGQA